MQLKSTCGVSIRWSSIMTNPDIHRSTEDFLRQQEAIDREPTMADVMRELGALRENVNALQKNVSALQLEQHKLAQALKSLTETDEYVLAKLAHIKPYVPFAEKFPPTQNIVALQAQLFRNTGSGKAPCVIKVYVWDKERARNNHDEIERWPDGYYRAFCFGLYAPKIFEGDPVLEHFAASASENHRIGYLEHKGLGRGKKIKGTQHVKDHFGCLRPDHGLFLSIRDTLIDFGTGTETKPTEAENAPVHIWCCNDLRL